MDNDNERTEEKRGRGRKPFARPVKKITVDLFEDQIDAMKEADVPISNTLRKLLDSKCADNQ